MTKTLTAAAIAVALSFGAVAGSANAGPAYGLTISQGQVNPFADKGGQ